MLDDCSWKQRRVTVSSMRTHSPPPPKHKQNNVSEVSEIMCESWNSFSFRFIFIYLFFAIAQTRTWSQCVARMVLMDFALEASDVPCDAILSSTIASHLILFDLLRHIPDSNCLFSLESYFIFSIFGYFFFFLGRSGANNFDAHSIDGSARQENNVSICIWTLFRYRFYASINGLHCYSSASSLEWARATYEWHSDSDFDCVNCADDIYVIAFRIIKLNEIYHFVDLTFRCVLASPRFTLPCNWQSAFQFRSERKMFIYSIFSFWIRAFAWQQCPKNR